MTENPKGPKKVGLERRVEVRMDDGGEVYFLTLYKNGAIEIRPKGARDPDATVTVTAGQVYRTALLNRASTNKPRRRRPVSRGMLATERRRKP